MNKDLKWESLFTNNFSVIIEDKKLTSVEIKQLEDQIVSIDFSGIVFNLNYNKSEIIPFDLLINMYGKNRKIEKLTINIKGVEGEDVMRIVFRGLIISSIDGLVFDYSKCDELELKVKYKYDAFLIKNTLNEE